MTRLHPADLHQLAREVAKHLAAEIRSGGTSPVGIAAPPRCNHGRFIYFAQADAPQLPTKIGIAFDVGKRLADIRGCCPHEVKLIAFYWSEDPKGQELALHDRFKAQHIRGEWFAWNDDLRVMVEDTKRFKALHTPHAGGGLLGALMGVSDDDEGLLES